MWKAGRLFFCPLSYEITTASPPPAPLPSHHFQPQLSHFHPFRPRPPAKWPRTPRTSSFLWATKFRSRKNENRKSSPFSGSCLADLKTFLYDDVTVLRSEKAALIYSTTFSCSSYTHTQRHLLPHTEHATFLAGRA